MNAEALIRMMRMIVPVRMQVTGVDGTWKLSQNKPKAARTAAADKIVNSTGAELDELAALMRQVSTRS
jgi:transcriptional regulator